LIDKLKFILKLGAILLILSIVLFGFYRREYLAQAIPVYVQYLKQKSKWKKVNTGTYAYIYLGEQYKFYGFVFNNKLNKVFRVGNGADLKYMINKENFKRYFTFLGQRKINDFIIHSRFYEIASLLWEKLWDKTPFQYGSKSHDYSVSITYNKKYGYPMLISYVYNGKAKSIGGDDWGIASLRLVMFPKDTIYTNTLLKKILNEYHSYYRSNIFPNIENSEKVGGDIVKGAVVRVKDKNESK